MKDTLHYTASGLGLAMVALVAVFAIGEHVPNPFTQPRPVQIEFTATGLMVAGALAALKWGRQGGLVTLAGCALFQAVEWSAYKHMLPWPFLIFALAGLLHLAGPGRKTTDA